MRVFGLVQDSIVDGQGLRFVCFVQGCSHNCSGCHNPESHDPNGGTEMTVEEIVSEMRSNPLTCGLTLSGGEPFEQARECAELAKAAHSYGLNVWGYTGYMLEYLQIHGNQDQKALLEEIDVLVDGRYVEELRSLSLEWRGSSNQRIIYLRKEKNNAE